MKNNFFLFKNATLFLLPPFMNNTIDTIVWDNTFDDIFCFNLGLAVGREAVKKHGKQARIVIGSDVRMYNNILIYRFIKGLKQGGIIQVVSAGLEGGRYWCRARESMGSLLSTSLMYYLTKGDFSFWVPFTASHNPSQYAATKIVDHNACPDGNLYPQGTDRRNPISHFLRNSIKNAISLSMNSWEPL